MEPERRFGHYRLLKLLGRGGMGEVWHAYDVNLEREVALKRMLPVLAEDEDFVERFIQEAREASRLNEPHIPAIHDWGVIEGRLYMDMRFIEGTTAAKRLEDGPLPRPLVVSIVRGVAAALDAAHKATVIHRDVKPANIVLATGTDFPHLIDFGISKTLTDSASLVGDFLVGSTPYMAPERFDGATADPRQDVYSLGCTAFELFTGRQPFTGENPANDHRHAPRPRASAVGSGLPPALDPVLARAMAVDPNRRFGSAGEFAETVALSVDAAPPKPAPPAGGAGGKSGTSRASGAEWPQARRPEPVRLREPTDWGRVGRWIGALVAVGAVASGIVWWSLRPSPPDPRIHVGDTPQSIALNKDALFVANSGSDSVSVVDRGTRSVAATIPVGDEPQAVVMSADGATAYVANHGSNTVSVIDTAHREVRATIPVGDGPVAMTLTRDGALLLVSDSDAKDITVIKTADRSVARTVPVSWAWGDSLGGVAVTPDGTHALVTVTSQFGQDSVGVVDLTRERRTEWIAVGEAPAGIAIGADGRLAYVANTTSGTVSVIDIANRAEATAIPVGDDPQNLVLGEDGRLLYVLNGTDVLAVVDTATNTARPLQVTDAEPVDMAVGTDGRTGYLVSPDSGTVAELPLR